MQLLKFFLMIMFFSFHAKEPDFVKEFHNTKTKKEELNFIEKYKTTSNIDIKAYLISLQMKQAEYKVFPWSKLKIFNREKKKLNKLIKHNPNNVHLRYIRLVIQEKTPKMLGYNKFIEEDKLFLKTILNKKDNTDYLDIYILKNTSL